MRELGVSLFTIQSISSSFNKNIQTTPKFRIDIGCNRISKLVNIEVSKIPNDFLMNKSTHSSVLMLENMFETHLKLQHEGLLPMPKKKHLQGNWATIMHEQDSLSKELIMSQVDVTIGACG